MRQQSLPEVRIAIRCDGSTEIGMGHVMECLALVRSLTRQARCRPMFLIRGATPGAALIERLGYSYERLSALNLDEELRELANVFARLPCDALIVDLPLLDPGYYERLNTLVPYLVAIFDHGEVLPMTAHQIVHYGVARPLVPRDARRDQRPSELLGPAFALLDEGLHRYWRMSKQIPDVCRRIFVNQGGSDPFRLTLKILQALAQASVTQEVTVVLGPAVDSALRDEVDQLRPSLSFPCRVEWAVNQRRLHALMNKCDLAITAAGNTLYELCAMGVPSVVVGHHDRHHTVAEAFVQHGAAINLGMGTSQPVEAIAAGIQALLSDVEARRRLSAKAKALVDGLGCARVAHEIVTGIHANRCESLSPVPQAI